MNQKISPFFEYFVLEILNDIYITFCLSKMILKCRYCQSRFFCRKINKCTIRPTFFLFYLTCTFYRKCLSEVIPKYLAVFTWGVINWLMCFRMLLSVRFCQMIWFTLYLSNFFRLLTWLSSTHNPSVDYSFISLTAIMPLLSTSFSLLSSIGSQKYTIGIIPVSFP